MATIVNPDGTIIYTEGAPSAAQVNVNVPLEQLSTAVNDLGQSTAQIGTAIGGFEKAFQPIFDFFGQLSKGAQWAKSTEDKIGAIDWTGVGVMLLGIVLILLGVTMREEPSGK